MEHVINIVLLVVGFIFLVKGADFFVDSASSIARRFNVSPLVIGLTLVAFGTSLPELAVSFIASLTIEAGQTADIAMGNVVGSNIVNLTLILGLTAIVKPINVARSMVKKEFVIAIVSALILVVFGYLFQVDKVLVWWEGLILLGLFTFYVYLMLTTPSEEAPKDEIKVIDMKKALVFVILGLAGVTIGGYMVTVGAENIALSVLVDLFGMNASKAVTLIGLTIVAVGTSLPEMVTSIVAAKKGENDIAFGNLVGSNIFNILFIIGLSSTVTTLGINGDVLIDTWIMTGVTLLALFFAYSFSKVSKKEGIFLVFVYVIYIAYIILRAFGIA